MTAKKGPLRQLSQWAWRDIKSGENTDLWILVIVSIIFTILGAIGIATTQVLSSIVLSLLAVLAISQIRSRQQIGSLRESTRASRTALLLQDFPGDYYLARSRATHSYFFAGLTMQRTLPTMRSDLERILSSGGKARILLPNPQNISLLGMIATARGKGETPERVASYIQHSLELSGDLTKLGDLSIRTTDVLPRLGINALDIDQPDALLMIQIYEFQPTGEASPILTLTRSDIYWFSHFTRQIERLWADGTAWPRDTDIRALDRTKSNPPVPSLRGEDPAPAAEQSQTP
jgi:hypothetical protein